MVSPSPSLGAPLGALRDTYRFPGFTPSQKVCGVDGDAGARIIQLSRREKKLSEQRSLSIKGVEWRGMCCEGGVLIWSK